MAQPAAAPQSTAIVQKKVDKIGTLRQLFEAKKSAIAAVIPKHLTAEKIAKITLSAISRNPELLACTQESIFFATIQAAELGLEFGPLGHAYLVPFRNNTNGKMEAIFIPGYKGLIELARRSDRVSTIEAHLVRERDHFTIRYGLTPELAHEPCVDGRDPGNIVCAYSIVQMRDGTKQFDHMTLADLEAVRGKSKAQNGPWSDEQARPEMYKKTMLKRQCKVLPMSKEMARAIEIDNAAEIGEPMDLSDLLEKSPELETVAAPMLEQPHPSPVESLKEKVQRQAAAVSHAQREPGQDLAMADSQLDRIEAKVDKILAMLGTAGRAQASGPAVPAIAPDHDLDSPYGDPVIRRDPKLWDTSKGSFAGYHYSETTPEYLEVLASSLDWRANKDDEVNAVDTKGRKKSVWNRRDAARARGWAQRLRNGFVPPQRPAEPEYADPEGDGSADVVAGQFDDIGF